MRYVVFFIIFCQSLFSYEEYECDDWNQLLNIQKPAIFTITKDNFQQLIHSHRFVVIDAYSNSCNPCKFIATSITELNGEIGHIYKFAKLNGNDERDLAVSLGIKGFPTLLFFKDGAEVGRQEGFINKKNLHDKILCFLL